MTVKKAEKADMPALAAMAGKLFGHCTEEDISELMENRRCAFFIAFEDGSPAGFAQCQLRRDYVEGTSTSPVGYLEGIFVEESRRGRGYAKAMLKECEAWAAAMGCREFASDCELTNSESLAFHLHSGFREANRIICFTKKL